MVKGDNARLLSVNSHRPIVLGALVGYSRMRVH